MAEHGGGGGGGSGAGFFLAFFAVVAVAWFFAEMRRDDQVLTEDAPAVTESVFDETPEPEIYTASEPAQPTPEEEHGVTYYLDEDGNILDVVYF